MRKIVNKSVLAIVNMALLASFFQGCGKNDEPVAQGSTVTDTRQLVIDGSYMLSKAQQTAMTNQNNEFAFRLFEAVSQSPGLKGKSVAVSPVSVTFALGMVANGGNEQTVSEITHVLGFGNHTDEGQPNDQCLNDLNAFCLSQLQQAATIDPSVTLHYANAVCLRESNGIYAPFEQAMNRYYQADIFPLDYSKEEAFLALNAWASQKTEGMIDPLFEKPYPPIVDGVLMNAIYLKAPWSTPFDKEKTAIGDFTKEDGTTTKVPLMMRTDTLRYTSTDLFSAVRLYYGQKKFSLTLLLPKEGHTVAEVAKSLDMETWSQTIAGLRKTTMQCYIPRFSTAEKIDLAKILSDMGAPTMFTYASLPYLLGHGKSTQVDDVFQKVRIDVDEAGTEGAAVTVVSLGRGGFVSLKADHPFVYVISDDVTDTIYFIGTYMGQ